jgi:hypothetical protein
MRCDFCPLRHCTGDPRWRLGYRSSASSVNLAEILEPHLAETKQQGESKFQHSEPLAHGELLYTMLHGDNRKAPIATRHQLQTCLGDIQQTKQVSTKCHTVVPQPPLG